jgi:hypothetical protein
MNGQKLTANPSCRCGPGGSSVEGATTGAPCACRNSVTSISRRIGFSTLSRGREIHVGHAGHDRRWREVHDDREQVVEHDGFVNADPMTAGQVHGGLDRAARGVLALRRPGRLRTHRRGRA